MFSKFLTCICFLCDFITRSFLKECVTISGCFFIHVFTISSVMFVIVFVGFGFVNPGVSFTVLTYYLIYSLTYS